MLSLLVPTQKGPETFSEQLDAFRHAITWSEPFILSLIAFQIIMFALTLYVAQRHVGLTPRVLMLIVIGIIVRSAEYVNRWAGTDGAWQSFCTQNYFDQRGIFISIFLCAPLLVNSFVMLVLFLREAAQLLIQVKKAELKQKNKQRGKNESGESSAQPEQQQQRRKKKDQ